MNKNIRILGLLFVLNVGSIYAQNISAGLFGGYQSSNIRLHLMELGEKLTLKTSDRATLSVGGIVEIPLYKSLSIRVEPQYLQGGGSFSPDLLIEEEIPIPELSFKTSYIEVPVLLKLAVGDAIRPYVAAGVTMGYRLDANIETKIAGLALEFGMKDLTKSFSWGVTFGAGVQIPLGSSTLFVEGRFTQGMTDILTNGTLSMGMDSEMGELDIDDDMVELKSEGFQIITGITIPLYLGQSSGTDKTTPDEE